MRRIACGMIFLVLPWLAQSEELYHFYDAVILKSFPNVPGQANLVSTSIQGFGGPSTAYFVRNSYDKLLIHDPMQARIVTLGSNYAISGSYSYKVEVSCVIESGKYLIGFTDGNEETTITISLPSAGKSTTIPNASANLDFPRGVLFYESLLLLHDRNRELSSYQFSSDFKGKPIFRDSPGTRNYLESNTKDGYTRLKIDDHDRVFLNGELVTQDFLTFKNFFSEKNGSLQKSGLAEELTANPNKFSTSTSYIGRDAAGNWYWGGGQGAAVFSPAGVMIDYFIFDSENWGRGLPYVSPNGDLYSLSWKGDAVVKLSLVRNVWDKNVRVGRLKDSRVRVRSGPDMGADILTLVDRGTVVAIVDSSPSVETINGITSPWYKVRLGDGQIGWLFGGFLGIEE